MKYYINNKAQSNGDHEVHTQNCMYIPNEANRKYLDEFDNCKDAVKEAKKTYSQSNGCNTCSNTCHTS
jgi:hypothetical protein